MIKPKVYSNTPRYLFEHKPGKTLKRYLRKVVPAAFVWKYGASSTIEQGTVLTPNVSSKVRNDIKNVPYKERVAKGEVFNNPFDIVTTTRDVSDSLTQTYTNRDGYFHEATADDGYYAESLLSWISFPVVVLPDNTDDERNAQTHALASMNSTQFDLGTFAAEWRKTQQLHRDLGNALLKLFKDGWRKNKADKVVRKKTIIYDQRGNPVLNRYGKPVYKWSYERKEGTFNKGSTLIKDAANLYLVGRYGIGPLLHDIESAISTLKEHPLPERRTARGRYTVQGQATSVIEVANPNGIGRNIPVTLMTAVTKDVRYGILYDISLFMSGVGQLGLLRPLKTAWELVPYSFVFDWGLQVGKWLDAAQPSGAHRILSAWKSVRITTVHTLHIADSGSHSRSPDSEYWTWDISAGATLVTVVKQRSPWNASLPKFPPLGTGFNKLRSFDFFSLVLQKLKIK